MALSASTVWEVRPGSGSATNGGGFVIGGSGTDWSQQNSAQYALTNGVTNGTTTIATVSASADMVGNIAYVAGGTGSITGAWYQIASQITGVSITVDRSTGLTAGTGVTINIGGAIDVLGTLFTGNSGTQVPVAGNIVWQKGTQTVTANWGPIFGGGLTSLNIAIQGYGSTRGDGTHAGLTTATNGVNGIRIAATNGVMVQWMDFTCTAGTPSNGYELPINDATQVTFQNCNFTGWSVGILSDNSVSSPTYALYLIEVKISGSVSHGMVCDGSVIGEGCLFAGNGGDGVRMQDSQTSASFFDGCMFYNNTGSGFNDQAGSVSRSNVLKNCGFGANGADGIRVSNSGNIQTLMSINSICYGNSGFGLNLQSVAAGASPCSAIIQRNNAFGSNTSGSRNTGAPAGINDVSLTANPWTNPSSGDFTLNSTAGGGAACAGAGWQSAIL